MKRFVCKIGGFFWSWGFLKFVLWTVTLIVLFYVEEDWRGARAWAVTKTKWEARGETLDYRKFFALPIPDAQNLGAIPLFRLERVNGPGGYLDDVPLQKAMESGWNDETFPKANGWIWGDLPDIDKIRGNLSAEYAKTFKRAPPSNDPLAQFDALFPFFSELRDASASRPYCRFAYDDTQAFPAGRGLGLVTGQIGLSRILQVHALLALNEHQSGVALADFETITKLGVGAGNDPDLVGGLVEIGLSSISFEIVYDGLALHAWSDPQLVEIDRVLRSMDFLATYRFAMRSEAAVSAANFDYFKKARTDMTIMWKMSPIQESSSKGAVRLILGIYSFFNTHWTSAYFLWPAGWFDDNKASLVDSILRDGGSVDERARRVYPDIPNELAREARQDQESVAGLAPGNVLCTVSASSVSTTPSNFAYAQTRVNEARIACALERYRLAHGAYPATLDLLVPDAISDLPHDVMNGEPYRYRLHPDGTFLLYSVGWNQTDNGGEASFFEHQSYNAPGHPSPDIEHGDWVWPVRK